jgi:hypothetical protein
MLRDESGATFVEFTAVVFTFLIIVLGFVDFSYAYYQWNSATKAVQYGARLAAVSDPVVEDLRELDGLSEDVIPGDPMPDFGFECTASATNGSAGTCTNEATYSADAMQILVFGRMSDGSARTTCDAAQTDVKLFGMCNIFSRIDASKVIVNYEYTGLGYAGRPGGPVPTITVRLRNLTFQYVFLGDLLGLSNITLPSFATTVTGEDLNVAGT